jgi:predicted permease
MTSDFRQALRLLWQSPGYAAVVVVTMALGIAGVTAVFTLADPMVFHALPYRDGSRIVDVRARVKDTATLRLHADDYVALGGAATSLEDVSTLGEPYIGTFRGGRDVILGGGVSQNFLHLTGLRPVIGRFFSPEEYRVQSSAPSNVALLTWPFWQSAFGGDPNVVGTRFELGGPRKTTFEVVGVLPREFFFPEAQNEAPAFIAPVDLDPRLLGNQNTYPSVLARLKSGVTFQQAEAELDPIVAGVERAHPLFEQGRRAHLMPLQTIIFGRVQTPVVLLFLATACLLLLSWVNLAHLARARQQARVRELAVRAALGAGRWRLIRLHLVEASMLAAAGAAAGLVGGTALFTWGMSQTPKFSHIYRLLPVGLDLRVFTFVVFLAATSVIAIGVWPAVAAVRADLRALIATSPGSRSRWRIGGERITIAGQTAFAVALVVTCLLVVHSFVAIVTADRGIDMGGVRIAGVTMPPSLSALELSTRYQGITEALGSVPGVRAAAVGRGVPALTLPDSLIDATGARLPNIAAYQVSGRFGDAMGMRLEVGRFFDDSEAFHAAPVAVVDRFAADMLWPGAQALGQTVRIPGGRTFLVVGVVAPVRRDSGDDEAYGTALVTIDTTQDAVMRRMTVIVRPDDRRPASAAAMQAAVERVAPDTAFSGTANLSSWERLVGQPRFLAAALGVLAGLTALLALFGILGVVSHLVAKRTREIGIRMALGANRASVQRLVIRQALVPGLIGIGAGLLLAFWWSATVRAVIIDVSPHDPWSFAIAAGVAVIVVVAASAPPARRASGIDPAVTLRSE